MKKQTDAKTLWTLFKSMCVLSARTFGGGFGIASLMKKKFVEELQRLDLWNGKSEAMDADTAIRAQPLKEIIFFQSNHAE